VIREAPLGNLHNFVELLDLNQLMEQFHDLDWLHLHHL
jgi:hypothetical protein